MFLNASEIDILCCELANGHSPLWPYANFLREWRDIVDIHSDGWAHWQGGPRAAASLMRLLRGLEYPTPRRAAEAKLATPEGYMAFRRALGRIKAAATRHRIPCPPYPAPLTTRRGG